METLRANTEEKSEYLRKLGYRVMEIFECEWNSLKETEKVISILRPFSRTIRPCKARSEYEFLDLIYNDKIFGLVLCDIETPPEKKKLFFRVLSDFQECKSVS